MFAKMKPIAILVSVLTIFAVAAACGGGPSEADNQIPETKVVAKIEVEPSPTQESLKPEPTRPPTPKPSPTEVPLTVTVTTKATGPPSPPTQVPPKAMPTQMPTPTIVGTVRFQVDVQRVTTASKLGQASIIGPSLIRLKDGRYRLYLQSRADRGNKNADGVNIISLISTDGTQWDFEPGTRIPHGSKSDVDSEAGEPGVYLGLDGKYYMAYTGRQMGTNKDGSSQLMHRAVFAVSDNGLTWTKLNKHYADPQNINDFVSSADVNIVNGEYIVYYTGQRNIIRATSQDSLTWVRQEIAISAGHDSTMVKYDGVYYMFAKMPEGLAYTRNADPRLDLLVMAISQDGVNWSKNYYQVVVENTDGSQVDAPDLQDPAAILLPDGSLRIFLNNDRGKVIYSIKPAATLPRLAP